MSRLDELEKEHDILYRKHNITNDSNKYICQDCKLNAWDENFPEYCMGPTTILTLGKINTEENTYQIYSKIYHIHDKALIELKTQFALDNVISLELNKDNLKNLIESFQKILDNI